MAAVTKQTQSVSLANGALSLASTLQGLLDATNSLVSQYGNNGTSTAWSAMATAALNADGSLGAADATPNPAHPIDTRVVTGLNHAVAANDLITFIALLQAYQAFMGNAAVATANRRAVIDPLTGG